MLTDPNKAKRWVWIEFVIAILLLAISGFFTFLYYGANDNGIWKEGLISDKDQEIAQLEKQVESLTTEKDELSSTAEGEKGTLEEQNATLKSQKTALEAKITKANAYNNFLKHMNSVVQTHNGFTGWTDAEYQTGLALAQATGDASFVSTVTWAWTQTSIDPTTRVIRVWNEIAAGIENSLK